MKLSELEFARAGDSTTGRDLHRQIINWREVGGGDRGGIYMASSRTILSQCSVKPLAIGRDASMLITPYAGELVSQNSARSGEMN